jgi:hypothetical protein
MPPSGLIAAISLRTIQQSSFSKQKIWNGVLLLTAGRTKAI